MQTTATRRREDPKGFFGNGKEGSIDIICYRRSDVLIRTENVDGVILARREGYDVEATPTLSSLEGGKRNRIFHLVYRNGARPSFPPDLRIRSLIAPRYGLSAYSKISARFSPERGGQ